LPLAGLPNLEPGLTLQIAASVGIASIQWTDVKAPRSGMILQVCDSVDMIQFGRCRAGLDLQNQSTD